MLCTSQIICTTYYCYNQKKIFVMFLRKRQIATPLASRAHSGHPQLLPLAPPLECDRFLGCLQGLEPCGGCLPSSPAPPSPLPAAKLQSCFPGCAPVHLFPASRSSCTKLAQSPACFLPPLQAALLKLHPSHPSSLAVSPKYGDSKFCPDPATGDSCFHSTPH